MPCYICNKKSQYYQRLDRSRIRFMRKVYPEFEESSYLCMKCFEKFEKIFKSKKKAKQVPSNISVQSGVTLKTVLSTTSSNSTSGSSVIARQNISSKENTQSNSSPVLKFLSHSISAGSEDSIDSTDRLVRKAVESRSLRDSSKVSRNADIIVAREGGQAAEKSALRRKRTREEVSPPQTPTGRRYTGLSAVPEDDDNDVSEIASQIGSDDLPLVRPIVKRRKEPVVYLQKDVMDIYLANTSGG